MKIPFNKPHLTEKEISAVSEIIKSGWITMGKKTFEFEDEFKNYIGSGHAIAVNSATAAMHLSLAVAGVGKGDEVILPAMTFVATAEAVHYCNAYPVMIDVDRETHLLDVGQIENKINHKTRAIIPVHYGGQPCDMDEIKRLAVQYNLAIVEDAAHSLPAWYRGEKIGSFGNCCCFSFYATKTLSTGEGGMITTGNGEWAEKMKRMRLHGIGKDAWDRYSDRGKWFYDVTERGYKYNTTDMNSALGLEQLAKLEWMWQERTSIAEYYNSVFSGDETLIPYEIKPDRVSAWHLYPLKLNLQALTISRNRFIEELNEMGIGTSVHFIPLYRFSVYQNSGYRPEDFMSCEWIYECLVSLPIYPGMKNDMEFVADCVLNIARKHKK